MDTVVVSPPATPKSQLWAPKKGAFTDRLGRSLVRIGELASLDRFDRISAEAARVLGQCLQPGGEDRQRTGLIIGYVQSGKTMSMTTVATLARDNGFRLIIAISGTTDNLFAQSCERFERDLRGSENRPGQWTILTNPTKDANGSDLRRLLDDWRDKRVPEDSKRTLFVVVMKQHSHLRSLGVLLGAANLSGIDALVIDDEADQASLNTTPRKSKASTTYLSIRGIRAALPKHTYLEYTATAQALILISLMENLSPDFADVLMPGPDYTGGQAFFSRRNDLVEEIPANDLPPQVSGNAEVPPSLLRAMRFFFLAAVAAPADLKEKYRSMLVHPHRHTHLQRDYRNWIHETKERWGEVLRCDEDDLERMELVGEFREPYESLCRSAGALRPLPELLRELATQLPAVLVTEVNSETGSEVEWGNAFMHILVGGQKLERGYTVKGLMVTYMPRGAGGFNADTIQQRARFFGYRQDYLGFCRVFLDQTMSSLYEEYVEHEESLRDGVIAYRGKPVKELRRVFILDSRYNPTRKNILVEKYAWQNFTGGWMKQSVPHEVIAMEDNCTLVDKFIRDLGTMDPFPMGVGYTVKRGVPLDEVLELLAGIACGPNDQIPRHIAVQQIERDLKEVPGSVADVILMGPSVRKRTLDAGKVQIHQGPSGKFRGDRNVFSDGVATLQVHWIRPVRPTGEGGPALPERVPALAFRPATGWDEWFFQRKRGGRDGT